MSLLLGLGGLPLCRFRRVKRTSPFARHLSALDLKNMGIETKLRCEGPSPSTSVDRCGLSKEAPQDVIDELVVFLLKTGMRDARHVRELFVRVRKLRKEFVQVDNPGYAVILTAHDNCRHEYFLGIDYWQFRAHVYIGSNRYCFIPFHRFSGKNFDHVVIRCARMIAFENTANDFRRERPTVRFKEGRNCFTPFG